MVKNSRLNEKEQPGSIAFLDVFINSVAVMVLGDAAHNPCY